MKKIFIFIAILILSKGAMAQSDKTSALYKTILSKDSLLFNIGFNTCDIKQFEDLLSDNFEFYHDKDSISDKTMFLYNLKNRLCASPTTYQSRRALVSERTEIYPMYKNKVLYAAIQFGEHRFYETINGKPETLAGTAKFTNLWRLENTHWKLSRCLSYDHQPAEK